MSLNPLRLSKTPLAALALLLPLGAFAGVFQADLFLPGIAGKDTIGDFDDLIPIDSFSTSGHVLSEDKRIDATSPLLYRAAASNQHFDSANIYVFITEPGKAPQLDVTYTFSDLTAEKYISLAPRVNVEGSYFAFSKVALSFPHPVNPVSAPELDASSIASEATLLVGGLLILCARPRRNRAVLTSR